MNANLLEYLQQSTGYSEPTVKSVIESFYKFIEVSLRNGDEVRIDRFGIFSFRDLPERKGRNPRTGEEIDVVVSIDMSGSISNKQAQQFLGEISGMMDAFDGYKIHVFCFDTEIYNPQDFNSENMDTIDTYEPAGGGGTDFDCIFTYLKDIGNVPKRLIVFTDGYPCGSWGDADYCDTTWIIHGDKNPNPPFGTYAIYDEK